MTVVKDLFKKYVKKHPGFNKFRQRVKKCLRMDHYSRRNRFFEINAPRQLGLASNQKAKKYKPLWDDLE
jgi:hypothetical protein